MKNTISFIFLGLLVIFAVFYSLREIKIHNNNNQEKRESKKINVVASFYPLAEFAKQVGKERVNVVNLTPSGVEPHDFEPTAKDLIVCEKSDVFIYNGAGFEAWVEKILPDLLGKNIIVVKASEELDTNDPHVWLDPILAGKQVDLIKKGFKKADPQNGSIYEKNATEYKDKLIELDREFQIGLSDCATRKVIISHQAISYLAKRYNLEIYSISGLSPDEEPSSQKMAEIVEFAKKNKLKYIFFETLISPRISETIAAEIGAKTLVFNPLEGLTDEELSQKKDYLSIQRENLANLRLALDCR